MAKLPIDISGQKGLVERHQGDLNDTSIQPHLRYVGQDGQFADGIFNPFKKLGYLSPANAKFASLTGTIGAGIVSMQYDAKGNILYLAENGENILQLSSLDDTSVANYLSITAGYDIKDMLLYEVNGQKSLVYIIDTNLPLIESPNMYSSNSGGMFLGFKTINPVEGATVLEKDVKAGYPTAQQYEPELRDAASVTMGTRYAAGRKLAQEFSGGDVQGRAISGVSLALRRSGGTGVGITIKVSIQGPAIATAGIYTSRGAWSSGVSYAVNDTVTSGGNTFACHTAHTSAAANTPPAGSGAEDYWNYFGAPSGTELASTTFSLSSIPVYATTAPMRQTFQFSSPCTDLDTGNYWIVIEEVGANMTATDKLAWLSTVNNTGIYTGYKEKVWIDSTVDQWISPDSNDPNTTYGLDTRDFRLIVNRDDNWTAYQGSFVPKTRQMALNSFGVDTGQDSFLYLADNSLVYWFVGNEVHTIDGTKTGGGTGRATEAVLRFPSYTSIPDCAETRGRMYIAVQTSERTSGAIVKNFVADRSGVFIWDRRSQVIGSTDFYPTPGTQEIKNLFVSAVGDVKAITVSSSGFTEIRGISGNQYTVLHTLEQNAFPSSRRGISTINNMSVWLGQNGIFYAYGSVIPGQSEQLYKIGKMIGEANAGFTSGPIFVGHTYASGPRQAIFYGWTDSDPSYVIQKWYPNGEGTIDAVAQLGTQGDAYSIVNLLPGLSQVNYIQLILAAGGNGGATTAGILKVYFNQSTSANQTFTITKEDVKRGFKYCKVGKTNIHALQVEFEWSTTETIGSDTACPIVAVVDYEPTSKLK